MKPLRQLLSSFARLVDFLEAGLYIVLGSCLFVGVVVVLPIALARDLLPVQPLLASGLVVVCAATLGCGFRDLLRRRWSFASITVCAIWIVCVAFVALH